MFQDLLEPIVKYVEAAARLATLQASGPINAGRRALIVEAGRDANTALRELTLALSNADTTYAQRETANVLALTAMINDKLPNNQT